MSDSLFFTKFMKEIQDEVSDVTETLINGSCVDFAEYKEKTGVLAGLNRAVEAAKNVRKDIFGE